MDDKKINSSNDDYIDKLISEIEDTGDILDDIQPEEPVSESEETEQNIDRTSDNESIIDNIIEDTHATDEKKEEITSSDKSDQREPAVSFKERLNDIKNEIVEQYKEIYSDYAEERKIRKRESIKEFYGGKPPADKKTRALYISLYAVKKFFSILGTSIFSIFLIFVLTGTIVGTTITVYLLSFMDSTTSVVLKDFQQSFASYIYQMNKETEEYELVYKATPASHDIKLATDLEKLHDYTKFAFVSIEDERFYSHEGVDFKRTGAAVVNLVLNKLGVSKSYFGGSTITQQLIKTVTGDDEDSWERKMREIFTAMKFEKNYTKDDILSAYLNEIYFSEVDGYHMYGIEAASIGYFGKPAEELTIAESAMLASIPKSPNYYNPTKNFEENKERKNICLYKMFELGVISADEYEQAVDEEVMLTTTPGFKESHPNCMKLTESDDDFKNPEINSWPVDTAIFEFGDYLKDTYELETRDDGIAMFNSGGYKIYLSADTELQAHLDETFSDWTYFPEDLSDAYDYPEDRRRVQAALAVMDYEGHILGIGGQIGKKEENLGWNNAYRSHRQPGSTIKPVTTYGYALENDLITWSTYFYDKPLAAGVAMEEEWPMNYDGYPSMARQPVYYFLKQSINTLPAQIVNLYGKQAVFDFATKNLHLDLDPVMDLDYSPLCVGGTSTGPTVINLANAYIPYGNGGKYYKASIISKVVDCKTDEVIIDNENRVGEQAVSEETAYIMNKMLQKVITDGTGTAAQLWNTIVAGKTGTTEDWRDITFVGLTPDYVSALWVGYPVGMNRWAIEDANSARIWKNVFGTYANEHAEKTDFPDCDTVLKQVRYCSYTGLIATSRCPGGGVGYYKPTDAYCSYH